MWASVEVRPNPSQWIHLALHTVSASLRSPLPRQRKGTAMKARPARARMPKTKTLLRTAVAATAAAALSWLALAGGSPLTGGTDGMAQATSVADEAPGY